MFSQLPDIVMKDSSTQRVLSMSFCPDPMVHKTDRDPTALHIVEKRTNSKEVLAGQWEKL